MFFGCLPCCSGCRVADGKPRTDPKNEGTWVPSGTWATGVTWTFTANPGDKSGETWFFYGSTSTSKVGGGATFDQRLDWNNICNWYSNKTTSPSITTGLPAAFDKRATRLPPEDAVVMIYTPVSTITIPSGVTVKSAYFFGSSSLGSGLSNFYGSLLTATEAAHDSSYGTVFLDTSNNGESSIINGGASFYQSGTNGNSFGSTVNGGAEFFNTAANFATAVVNGGAKFYGSAGNSGTVNDGAEFYNASKHSGTINDGATFNDNSQTLFFSTVNGGATFNDNSENNSSNVNDGATFNDAACSKFFVGSFFATPCTRQFVAHPTDLPTCNGTAKDGCFTPAVRCGCG